jgi:hypothetical protein
MPYVKTPSEKHRCSPPNPNKAILGHSAGAVWQCPRCKTRWVLEDDRAAGPGWTRVKAGGR